MKKYTYPIKLGLLIAVLVNSYSANAEVSIDATTAQASTDLILDAATTLLGSGTQTTKDSGVNSAFTSIQSLIPSVLNNASSPTEKSAAAELVITTIIQNIKASGKSEAEKNQAIALLVGQASKAFPEYAANFTTAAVTAAPTLATDITSAAVAAAPGQARAITNAAVSIVPSQALVITTAATNAAPGQAGAITRGAADAAPAQAAAIAAAANAAAAPAPAADANTPPPSSESTVAQRQLTAQIIVAAATSAAASECAGSHVANCFNTVFKAKTTELAAQTTSIPAKEILAAVDVVIKNDPSVSAH